MQVTDRRPTLAWRRWVVAGAPMILGIILVGIAGDGIDTGWAANMFLVGSCVLVLGGAFAVVAVSERAARVVVAVALALMIFGSVSLLAETDRIVLTVVGTVLLLLAIGLFVDGLRTDRRHDRAEALVAARSGTGGDDRERVAAGLPARGPTIVTGWWRPMLGRTILAAVVLAGAVALTVGTAVGWRADHRREARSTLVLKATVVRHIDDEDRLIVRYRVPLAGADGETIETETSVLDAADYPVGSTATVHVDPDEPASIWIERYDPTVPFVVAVLGTAVALMLLARPFLSLRAQARLLQDLEAPDGLVQIQAFEGSLRRVGLWRSPDGPPSGWWSVRPRKRCRRPYVGQEVLLVGSPRVGGQVAVLSPDGPIWLRGRLASDRRLHGRRPIAPLAVPAWIDGGQPLPPPPVASPHPPGWVPPPTAPPWVPPAAGLPTPPAASAPPVPLPPPPPPASEAVTTPSPAADESAEPSEPADEQGRSPERWTPPAPWRPTDRWQPDHPGGGTDGKTSPGAF